MKVQDVQLPEKLQHSDMSTCEEQITKHMLLDSHINGSRRIDPFRGSANSRMDNKGPRNSEIPDLLPPKRVLGKLDY